MKAIYVRNNTFNWRAMEIEMKTPKTLFTIEQPFYYADLIAIRTLNVVKGQEKFYIYRDRHFNMTGHLVEPLFFQKMKAYADYPIVLRDDYINMEFVTSTESTKHEKNCWDAVDDTNFENKLAKEYPCLQDELLAFLESEDIDSNYEEDDNYGADQCWRCGSTISGMFAACSVCGEDE